VEPFLKQIAVHLYNTYGGNLQELCLVFPNRRASLYFNKYLSELAAKPIWAPSYETISSLMQQISGLQLTDSLNLIFELFPIYQEEKKTDESFDHFYFYGEMMVADFDDIDKYLVNAADLFRNLQEIKDFKDLFPYLEETQIEAIRRFWENFSVGSLTAQKQDFISIWEILFKIYSRLNGQLKEKGIAYEGMIYREAVNRIRENKKIELPYDRYIFVGFNALSVCEKDLFDFLKREGKAEFYWDYDEYFLSNPKHEAGFFMRKNIELFPSPDTPMTFTNLSKKKEISLINIASDLGQAKALPGILASLGAGLAEKPDQTAVVLADEHLLMPVIKSLPDSIPYVNVTMGYPVRQSPAYAFVHLLLRLQQHARQSEERIPSFFYKDVEALLSHPYVRIFPNEVINSIGDYIKKNNLIFFQLTDNIDIPPFLKKILNKQEGAVAVCKYILDILLDMAGLLNEDHETPTLEQKIETEYLYYLYLAINRLNDILISKCTNIGLPVFIRLLDKVTQPLRVPFSGEPLSGLQVMGILETRLLDFENIVVLSMNEGVLPKRTAAPSFIPYNLRRGFGLPTLEHQDAIYSYYFYRLLQRCNNAILVYNSRSDDAQTGEMSRFLMQLKYDSRFQVKEKTYVSRVNLHKISEIIIPSNDKIVAELKHYLFSDAKGYLSPSAVNTYVSCSLRFYFAYIAHIQEKTEVAEQVDQAVFGSILHKSMQILYTDFVSQTLSKESITAIRKNKENIHKAIVEALCNEFYNVGKSGTIPPIQGRNKVIVEIMEHYIDQLLNVDQNYAPFVLAELESKISVPITFDVDGLSLQVNLGGRIDRIDEKDGICRIVDYKTGKVDTSVKSIDSLFDPKENNRNSPALQLFLYSLLMLKSRKDKIVLQPTIIALRNIFDEEPTVPFAVNKIELTDFSTVAQEYEILLQTLFSTLFSKNSSFVQTADVRKCSFCPYIEICQRG
jgi:hypothetical protein